MPDPRKLNQVQHDDLPAPLTAGAGQPKLPLHVHPRHRSDERARGPPLVLLLAALALDALFGEARGPFARLPHPVRLIRQRHYLSIANSIAMITQQQDRRLRGVLTVILILGPAFAVGWILTWFGRAVPFGSILNCDLPRR